MEKEKKALERDRSPGAKLFLKDSTKAIEKAKKFENNLYLNSMKKDL